MLSNLVASYLFLGGAGAGSLFVLGILDIFFTQKPQKGTKFYPRTDYRRIFVPGFGVGLLALCLGVMCLVVDLGRVERITFLFVNPTFSYISLGVFVLSLLIFSGGFLFVVWNMKRPRFRRAFVLVVEGTSILAALLTMVYTGLFLQSISAVAFWASPFLPLLFVLSSVSSGIALVIGAVFFTGSGLYGASFLVRLVRIDAGIILLEILCLGAFLVLAFFGENTAASCIELLGGSAAWVFWLGLVGVGLGVPLVLDVFSNSNRIGLVVGAAISVLVGGYCLRWCVIVAGIAPDVISSAKLGLGM